MMEDNMIIDDDVRLWGENNLFENLINNGISCFKHNKCLNINVDDKLKKITCNVQKNVMKKKFISCIPNKDKEFNLYKYFVVLLINFQDYCLHNNKVKMELSDFKMKRYLLAILHLLSLECIVTIDTNTMADLTFKKYSINYSNNNNGILMSEDKIHSVFSIIRKIESMGVYFKQLPLSYLNESDELRKLKNKFIEEGLNDNVSEINNIIFICEDNMKFFLDKLENYDRKKISKDDLIRLVYLHEIGHLIFSYEKSNDRLIQERQANLVASYLSGGFKDDAIETITKYQLEEYHNPLLISRRCDDFKAFDLEYEKLYTEGR